MLLLIAVCFIFRDIQLALNGFGSVAVVGKDTVMSSPPLIVRQVSSQVVVSGFADPNSRWAFGYVL